MALKELVDRALQNRERVVAASKGYLKGSMSLDEYLAELENFRREQSAILSSIAEEARRLDPLSRARTLSALLNDGRLGSLSQIIGMRLRERDHRLGRWASLVLEERFQEAGEPPVPVAERAEAARQPQAATHAAPIQPIAQPVQDLVIPRGDTAVEEGGSGTRPAEPPTPVARAIEPERPQPTPARVNREALIAAVDRAVGRVRITGRERSAIEVFSDLDRLLSRGVLGAEQYLVFIARLVLGYLLGSIDREEMAELAEEYVSALKSSADVVRPEVRGLVLEAMRLAESRPEPELKSIVAAVQLYMSGQTDPQGRVEVVWSRQPSS
ncbi:MAG: hypothetical protein QXW56_02590 [Nitrososphaerota archaeon]